MKKIIHITKTDNSNLNFRVKLFSHRNQNRHNPIHRLHQSSNHHRHHKYFPSQGSLIGLNRIPHRLPLQNRLCVRKRHMLSFYHPISNFLPHHHYRHQSIQGVLRSVNSMDLLPLLLNRSPDSLPLNHLLTVFLAKPTLVDIGPSAFITDFIIH